MENYDEYDAYWDHPHLDVSPRNLAILACVGIILFGTWAISYEIEKGSTLGIILGVTLSLINIAIHILIFLWIIRKIKAFFRHIKNKKKRKTTGIRR